MALVAQNQTELQIKGMGKMREIESKKNYFCIKAKSFECANEL